MNHTYIHHITQKSEKAPGYIEYIQSIQKNFTEIPWINSVESLYSEILLTCKETDFISGVALFLTCPENTEISKTAQELFGKYIFISCLYTKPEYRHMGYGYALLNHAIVQIKSKKYTCVGIVNNTDKELIESYKKYFSTRIIFINSKISFIEFK